MYVPHWPTKADYDEAIEKLSENILDRELRQGCAVTRSMLLQRRESPDRPVCLYSIDLPQGSRQMLRCFCQNDKEQHQSEQIFARYEQLDLYQQQLADVAAFVPITYIAQGIRVNCSLREHDRRKRLASIVMPIVKMPFIRGRELGMYIAEHYENKEKMRQLCDRWWQMIEAMEAIPMAHGDLDLTNILVVEEEDTLMLKLVDYDNMWIPGFELYDQPEHGHEHFQHPAFYAGKRPYNAEMDRSSALVIYLSLLAIALNTKLYKDYKVNETRLLFSSYDYREEIEHHTSAIGQLKRYNIAELTPFIDELCTSLHTAHMPRRLSAIAAQPKPPHSDGPIIVPPKPPPVEPKKLAGRRVVIETDWSDADKFVRSGGPVSPAPSPLPPVHTQIGRAHV